MEPTIDCKQDPAARARKSLNYSLTASLNFLIFFTLLAASFSLKTFHNLLSISSIIFSSSSSYSFAISSIYYFAASFAFSGVTIKILPFLSLVGFTLVASAAYSSI